MTFITNSNFKRVLFDIQVEGLEGDIYKEPIFFHGEKDKTFFLSAQQLLKDGTSGKLTIFKKIEREVDSHTLVYEGGQPAYHNDTNCERLHSDYNNFRIPQEIQDKGVDEVSKFRAWYKKNQYLFDEGKETIFNERLRSMWGIAYQGKVFVPNRGFTQIPNKNLEELENEIDKILKESRKYFVNSNPKEKNLISKFQKWTFNSKQDYDGYAFEDITGSDIAKFIESYNDKFKKPIRQLLLDYYRVKLNPKLEFKGTLLEQLGFKPCPYCITK